MRFARDLPLRESRTALNLLLLSILTVFYAERLWSALAGKGVAFDAPLLGRSSSPQLASTALLICLLSGFVLFLMVKILDAAKFRRLGVYVVILFGVSIGLMITLSGVVLDFVIFTLIILAGLFPAYRLLRLLRLELATGLERLAFAITLGLAYYIMLVFFLGIVGVLFRITLIGVMVLGILLCRSEFFTLWADAQRLKGVLLTASSQHKWLIPIVIASLGALLISFTQAVAPDIQYDAIHIQLYVADTYAEHGEIVRLVSTDRSYVAKGANMLFAVGYVFDSEVVAKLFSWLPLVIFGLYLPSFTARYLKSTAVGVLAFGLLVTMPIVGWTAGTAYQESLTMLFVFGAIYSLLRWGDEPTLGWAFLTGLLSGVALFAKIQAMFVLIGMCILIGLVLLQKLRKKPKDLILQIGAFTGAFVLTGLPWYLLVYVWTGNPLYPFFNNIFQSPYYPPIHNTNNLPRFGLGHDVKALMMLPWNLTFRSANFNEEAFGNTIVGLVIIVLPLWFLVPQTKKTFRIMLPLFFIIFANVLIWITQAQYIRYLMYTFPICAVIAAHLFYQTINGDRVFKPVVSLLAHYGLFIVLIISLIFTLKMWWNIPNTLPLKYILGQQNREEYLSTTFYGPEAEAYQFIHRQSQGRDSIVVTVGVASHALYQESSKIFHLDDVRNLRNLLASHPEYTANILEYLGITYVVLAPQNNRVLSNRFIDQFLVPVYGNEEVVVYEFYPHNRPLSDKINLVHNGDFEIEDGSMPANWSMAGAPELQCAQAMPKDCYVQVNTANLFYQAVPVQEHTLYELSLRIRAAMPAATPKVRMQVNWVDDAYHQIDVTLILINGSSRWKGFTRPLTAPKGATQAVIYLATDESLYADIDDVAFEVYQYNPFDLIQNGDFEITNGLEPVNWSISGAPELRCEQENCYIVVNTSSLFYQAVPVQEHTLYELSLQTRTADPTSIPDVRLQANWVDDAYNQIDVDLIVVKAGSAWSKFSLVLTPPAGATQAVIYLTSDDNVVAAIDQVAFESYQGDLPPDSRENAIEVPEPLTRWKELIDCIALEKTCDLLKN
ncbi:MAG: hypothetical protein K8L91_07470 [Anaerolineae bacterium]|nr:hypothetical protein [Anaerolineae bacterium]